MDGSSPTGAAGLLGSLRGIAEGMIGSVHDRVELFSVELQEEKHRLVQTFLWMSAVVVLAVLAMIFGSLAVVVLFWDTAREGVVVALALGYLGAWAAAWLGFRRFLLRQPKPFAASLRELREDRQCVQAES